MRIAILDIGRCRQYISIEYGAISDTILDGRMSDLLYRIMNNIGDRALVVYASIIPNAPKTRDTIEAIISPPHYRFPYFPLGNI